MKIKNADFALLILRLGIGLSVVVANGYGKMSGGVGKWEQIGASMSVFGITFLPVFWGFMNAFAEFFGSLMVAFGFLTRLGAFLVVINMMVALFSLYNAGQNFTMASHALEVLIAFLVILITGPGKYSIDSRVKILRWIQ